MSAIHLALLAAPATISPMGLPLSRMTRERAGASTRPFGLHRFQISLLPGRWHKQWHANVAWRAVINTRSTLFPFQIIS